MIRSFEAGPDGLEFLAFGPRFDGDGKVFPDWWSDRRRGKLARRMSFEIKPVAVVESSLKDRSEAPKQGREGAPDAWLVFEPEFLEGLEGIAPGDRVILLTWFDRAERDVLRVIPRDDPANPMTGVFATRSSDRPNPIGLHEVEVLEIDGRRMHVEPLEAIDGTPIIDVKPVI